MPFRALATIRSRYAAKRSHKADCSHLPNTVLTIRRYDGGDTQVVYIYPRS